MMAPHALCHKILVENHDVPIAGHMGINRTVDLIKRHYCGAVYGAMQRHTCGHVQFVNARNQTTGKRPVNYSLFLS